MRRHIILLSIALAALSLAVASFSGGLVLGPLSTESAKPEVSFSPAAKSGVSTRSGAPLQRSMVRPADQGPCLRVIDARDGTPIEAARVRFAGPESEPQVWSTAHTGETGEVVCPTLGEPVAVAVSAIGFAPSLERWPAGVEPTITLQPAATLTLRFVDPAGEPVPGVKVRLLPPLLRGRIWADAWRSDSDPAAWAAPIFSSEAGDLPQRLQDGSKLSRGRFVDASLDLIRAVWTVAKTSSEDGIVHFDGLPAGNAWRWAVDSGHAVDMEPRHESAATVEGDVVRTRAGAVVVDLSGPIELAAAASREFVVTVHHLGTLTGCIPAPGFVLRPQVKLYSLERTPGPQGKAVVELSPMGFTTTARDGTFTFEDVPPGPKVVRAFWRRSADDYVFVTRTAMLGEGERRDLGDIRPLSGELRLMIELKDREGCVVDPGGMLKMAKPKSVVLVEAWEERGQLANSIFEAVAVPLGREVRFHGFAPGAGRVRAMLGVDWPALDEGQQILPASSQELTMPRRERLDLPMIVEARVRREFELLTPPGPTPALEVWLRPLRGGAADRIEVPADALGRAHSVSVTVLPEPYEILVRSPKGTEAEALVSMSVVDFARPEPQRVSLSRGGSLTGTCHRSDGSVMANQQLFWTCKGWQREGNDVWLIRSHSDEHGRFAIYALPPGVSLRGARPGMMLTAPQKGAAVEVQMTVR